MSGPSLGAVACGHEFTAAAAREVLEEGGNAFDAVVAAALMACVAEPVLCSLGGGGYLLAASREAEPVVYDFFTDTPRTRGASNEIDLHPVNADFGSVTQQFHVGLGAVATPGMPAGLFEVHRDLCRLPMRRLAEPAVRAARDGVVVNRFHAYLFQVVAPIYVATQAARAIYGEDRESLAREGQRFRQPDLAVAIELLAREGPDLFYRGEMGRRLIEQCRRGGGQLAPGDLDAYQVRRREPLAVSYRGARIFTNPPPSRGGMLIAFALALLAEVPVDGREQWLRTLVEALRLTDRARAEAGDALLDRGLLDRYRAELGSRPGSDRGTTHVSVADAEGNLAAASFSNGEGCGHVLAGTGIMLNNMLGEEDINPRGLQRWQPGMRMASMMAPTLVEQPGARTVLGSGGSKRIRSAMLQVVANLVAMGMPLEDAVVAPRVHAEDGLLSVEGGFSPAEEQVLSETGLRIERWSDRNFFFGGVHVVRQQSEALIAAGDPRRGGVGLTFSSAPAAS